MGQYYCRARPGRPVGPLHRWNQTETHVCQMNRKQLALIFVLLVVVGGAGLLLQKSSNQASSAGEQGTGGKLLGDHFPINDVANVTIKHDTNEVTLLKKDDTWRVHERNDYAANFSQL